jgi:hypothetical protein
MYFSRIPVECVENAISGNMGELGKAIQILPPSPKQDFFQCFSLVCHKPKGMKLTFLKSSTMVQVGHMHSKLHQAPETFLFLRDQS